MTSRPPARTAHGTHQDLGVPAGKADLTPEWLTAMLVEAGVLERGRVTKARLDDLGADYGYSGTAVRVHLEYDDAAADAPASLIAKLPSEIRRVRAWGVLYQGYEREARFYRQLASRCSASIPRCYFAGAPPAGESGVKRPSRAKIRRIPGWIQRMLLPVALFAAGYSNKRYALILEDLAFCDVGDQVTGATIGAAAQVATALSGLHGSFWQDEELSRQSDWLPDRIGGAAGARSNFHANRQNFVAALDRTPPSHFDPLMQWADEHLDRIYQRLAASPHTLLHGDFRLDNLFLDGDTVWMTDWETVAKGQGIIDWAHFVVTSLRMDVDESDEHQLLRTYHQGLVNMGVRDYDFDACRRGYTLAKIVSAYSAVGSHNWRVLENERLDKIYSEWNRRMFARMPEGGWAELLEG